MTATVEEQVEGFRRALLSVQITLRDRFTPTLRRTAITFEIFNAQAGGKWNRYQMVGWRRDDGSRPGRS